MIRFIQPCPFRESNGLVIGFGIPRNCDTEIRSALPNWGIVLTEDCPPATLASIQAMRRAASRDADTPLLLLGLGKGAQTVFRMAMSNLLQNVIGIAFFDGEYPLDEHSQTVWRQLTGRGPDKPRVLVDLTEAPEAIVAALGPAPEAPVDVDGPAGEGTPERIGRMLAIYFGPGAMPDSEEGPGEDTIEGGFIV